MPPVGAAGGGILRGSACCPDSADLPVLQGTGAMVGPCPLLGQPDAASCGALRDAMPRYPGMSNTTFVQLNVRTPWDPVLCMHSACDLLSMP